MAKKGRAGNGYVGMFGQRPAMQKTMWISGFITADLFAVAKRDLEKLYLKVNGRRPSRVTKTDVVEYLLMGDKNADRRLRAMKTAADRRAEERRADDEYFRSGTRYPGQ